jgi:hypothetical protein
MDYQGKADNQWRAQETEQIPDQPERLPGLEEISNSTWLVPQGRQAQSGKGGTKTRNPEKQLRGAS